MMLKLKKSFRKIYWNINLEGDMVIEILRFIKKQVITEHRLILQIGMQLLIWRFSKPTLNKSNVTKIL